MTPMQIAVLSIALAGFAGLLVIAPKLRIRPWVLMLAGLGGTALGLLACLLMSRIHSLGQMAAGVLLVCAAGALVSVAVSLLAQRVGKRTPPRDMLPARSPHAVKAGVASELSGALASAQGREFALLSAPAARPAAITLIPGTGEPEEEPAESGQAVLAAARKTPVPSPEAAVEPAFPYESEPQRDETLPEPEDEPEEEEQARQDADDRAEDEPPTDAEKAFGGTQPEKTEEIDRLARGFRKEQERRARAEEKRLEAERLAKEEAERKRERERLALEEEIRQKEQERAAKEDKRRHDRERRIIRRGEERRLKDARLGAEADEAQRIRERIAAERQKVAIEEQQKLEAAVAEAAAAEAAAAEAAAIEAEKRRKQEESAAAESWAREQERLARELEERKREQEMAAEDEKRWIIEQERLAREQEERRLEQEHMAREQERLAREREEHRLEQERLALEQEELRLEQERLECLERERRENAERERAEQLARCNAEAGEYLAKGRELSEESRYIEALQWLEKAARVEASNEVRVVAGIAIIETLIELGWKGEALKKMQAMKAGLVIEGDNRKRLGELAMKLIG